VTDRSTTRNVCPACQRANAPDAHHCKDCGAELPSPAGERRDRPRSEPQGASITLRDVKLPPLQGALPAPQVIEEWVWSDLDERPRPQPGDPAAERAVQRAERRAEVRRERLRDAASSTDAQPTPEALVLSAADAASSPLCTLLKAFGFGVRMLCEPPQLPAPWPFAAVFVDHALRTADGGDAIELCNQVRECARLPGERMPALVLVADQLSPTDRVRAGLAGCREVIVGEVTRGSVARALEAHGIALPSDARRR
jgi:hypothetical protein